MYSQDSLETLRKKIDLIDVLSSHIELKRSGATFKACCPFHEEKTPSFMVKRGDTHYHCFGCGAHGDAIAFLMEHLKMEFIEAVEYLAERFQVPLMRIEGAPEKGPSRFDLKMALEKASQCYHFLLLHSKEGKAALSYLYERGIDLSFIKKFHIGYAPKRRDTLLRFAHEEAVSDEVLETAGLVKRGEDGKLFDFFSERILFPISDSMGSVIGFSGRKFLEHTVGGKYVNTAETPLFKKSHVLFGLSHSRRRIAKERKSIIVEGQIDALSLIDLGFDYTVAAQGTAFGDGHVQELVHLGVKEVFLCMDADDAGREAALKIGDLFQKVAVSVKVLSLPEGMDPDSFLKEEGAERFSHLLEAAEEYLPFAFKIHLHKGNAGDAAHKSAVIEALSKQIRTWDHPVMVYESLRLLAKVAEVPESTLGHLSVRSRGIMRKGAKLQGMGLQFDPNKVLEVDLLRWLFFAEEQQKEIAALIEANICVEDLRISSCQKLFTHCFRSIQEGRKVDFLSLGGFCDCEEDRDLIADIMHKKINLQKLCEGCKESIKAILERNWLEQMEAIQRQLESSVLSDQEMLELAKEFAAIRKNPPTLKNLIKL